VNIFIPQWKNIRWAAFAKRGIYKMNELTGMITISIGLRQKPQTRAWRG
jgi:hypothetical protein